MTKKKRGVDPGLANLIKKAPNAELDYGFVMDCLKDYKNPRIKLNHLLKIEALIKIKKGIYIFGDNFAHKRFCPEVLANMIYGPSYVSLEWACQYWRLIPEKVTVMTSVTPKRSKAFSTPVGRFTYDHLPLKAFSIGMTLIRFFDNQSALIATPEKALVDLITLRRGVIRSIKHMRETLFEDLRIEEEDFYKLRVDVLHEIHEAHPHTSSKLLLEFFHE